MIVGPIRGLAQLSAAITAKQKKISNAVGKAITRGALAVQGAARSRILKGPKNGKTYKYGKGGKRRHVASAPTQAPANWTGNLARSLKVVNATESGGVWTAKVTANAPYAAALEFGTRGAGRTHRVVIEARPFLTPSVKELAPKIHADIKRAVAEGMA